MDKCMLSNEVTGTQDFIDMTIESQYLYFRMCLNSNSTGMVDGVPLLARMFGIDKACINELVENGFIIQGRIKGRYWITHWFNMNTIDKMGAPADINDFLNIERKRAVLNASTAPKKYYSDTLMKRGLIESVPDYSTICSEVDDQSTTSRIPVDDQSATSRRPVGQRREEKREEETSCCCCDIVGDENETDGSTDNNNECVVVSDNKTDDNAGSKLVYPGNYMVLTESQQTELIDKMGKAEYTKLVTNMAAARAKNSTAYRTFSQCMCYQDLLKWYNDDVNKGTVVQDKSGSFDTDEFFNAALNRTYSDKSPSKNDTAWLDEIG